MNPIVRNLGDFALHVGSRPIGRPAAIRLDGLLDCQASRPGFGRREEQIEDLSIGHPGRAPELRRRYQPHHLVVIGAAKRLGHGRGGRQALPPIGGLEAIAEDLHAIHRHVGLRLDDQQILSECQVLADALD